MSAASTVPNLDAMDHEDLMSFWAMHQRGRVAWQVFPNGGKGTRNATGDLACYASNKATAIACRLRGDIATALSYERICDSIYEGLPAWARW